MERFGRKHYKRRKRAAQGRKILPLLFCSMLLAATWTTVKTLSPSIPDLLVIRDKEDASAERETIFVGFHKETEPETSSSVESNDEPVETMLPNAETSAESATETATETTDEPAPIGLRQRIPSDYDYGAPVPESDEVTIDYLNDAVLIGDSRMQGLILYCGLSRFTSYTYKGLTVDSVFTKPVIEWEEAEDTEENKIPEDLWNDGKVPVMSALSQTNFNKVYIMLGINETGWPDATYFSSAYGKVLDAIREQNPDCLIYMLSVFPVTKAVSDTHDYVTNEKIALYNTYLQQLAFEKEVFFVDLAPAVVDENGVLPADSGLDGIHLNKAYCTKVLDYILTHTVPLQTEEAASTNEPHEGA